MLLERINTNHKGEAHVGSELYFGKRTLFPGNSVNM